MICPNCKEETNGLKLNNRLYCTECGFDLLGEQKIEKKTAPKKVAKEPELRPKTSPEPKEDPFEAEPKFISNEEVEDSALAPLEAEKEVLDLVEKEATKLDKESKNDKPKASSIRITKNSTREIIKHNRKRTDLKHEGDFVLIKGEPDPIAEPEIEPAEKINRFPENLKSKEPEEPPKVFGTAENFTQIGGEKTVKQHFDVFKKPETEEKSAEKDSQEPKAKWNIALMIGIPIIIICAFLGLVLYVNLIAINPDHSLKVAEASANFSHLKPTYLPNGYTISYQTTGNANTIQYIYEYQPAKSNILTISAEKSKINESTIFSELISKKSSDFALKSIDDVNYWEVGEDSVYFVKDGILYSVKATGDLSTPELLKTATNIK